MASLSTALTSEKERLVREGFVDRGFATPDMDPGIQTSKVFYLASEVGTYEKFGNIEVGRGDTVLLVYDTSLEGIYEPVWGKVAVGVPKDGSGGSSVELITYYDSGTRIATLDIDGDRKDIFIPKSEGGGAIGSEFFDPSPAINGITLKSQYNYIGVNRGLYFDGNTGSGPDFEVQEVNIEDVPIRVLHSRLPIYSDSFISAGGLSNTGGSSGTSLQAVWNSLEYNNDEFAGVKINQAHLPDIYQPKYSFTITGNPNATYDLSVILANAANGASAYNYITNGLYVAGTLVQTSAARGTLLGINAISYNLSTNAQDTTVIEWDSVNNAWHVRGNLYADGWISAAGRSSSPGGGGTDLSAVWDSLSHNSDEYAGVKIDIGHLPYSAGSGINISPTGVITSLFTGTVTSVGITVPTGLSVSNSPITSYGDIAITFASGYSIPTIANQNAWSAKYDKPSTGIPQTDLASAVSTKIDNGSTAYGYFTSGVLDPAHLPSMYIGRTSVIFTPTNTILLGIDAISNAASSAGTDNSRIVWDSTNNAWHFLGNVYADGWISAAGISSSGGATSGYLYDLKDVSTTISGKPTAQKILVFNPLGVDKEGDTNGAWEYADLPTGSVSTVAGVSPVNGDIPVASLQTAIGLGNYLPLSGGIIENNDIALTLKRTSSNPAWLKFSNADGSLGDIGVKTTGLYFRDTTEHLVYHDGNFTPSNYVLKAGDTMSGNLTMGANTVVFTTADATTWATTQNSGLRILNSISSAVTGAPARYYTGLSVWGYYGFQLASNSNANVLKFRGSSSAEGTYADWVTIYHSGNFNPGNYLPLAGGTLNDNAVIKRTGSSVSWVNGRDYPIIRTSSYTGYNAILSMKTTNGSWELGVYTSNTAYLTYITDTNYNNQNNSTTYQLTFPKATGTIALTSNIPTSLPASDVYAWAKAATKPTYNLDEVADGSTRKLANYLPLAGGTMTGTLTMKTSGTGSYNQGIRINRVNTSSWALILIGKSGDATSGTGTTTAGDGAWLIGTPASSNSLVFNLNTAGETVGLCLKGHGTTDMKWNNTTVWCAGNDGASSGLDADLLDGQHGSYYATASSLDSYLPLAGGTMTGALTFSQGSSTRRNGIIGTYDANRAAAIWTIGSSYQIAADGMTMGNLYGACYAYYGSGYTYGAGKSGGHSFVWCQSGSPTVALGNNVWTSGGFIKNGGTSSQFLKADGSVDSNAYITGITSSMVTTALGYTPYYSGNSNKSDVNWTCNGLYANRVFLSRVSNASYGRISFYSSSYYTWYIYMTPTGSSYPCPTGAATPSGSVVTSWALRTLIENASGYGWTWESCSNGQNQTPVIQMELSSNTGVLVTRGDQVISSDRTLKTNLIDLKYTVRDIANAPAVTFDRTDIKAHSFGSIAQYWLPICREMVQGKKEGEYTIAYAQGAFTNSIINARAIVKLQEYESEQDKEIRLLKERVRNLEDQLRLR